MSIEEVIINIYIYKIYLSFFLHPLGSSLRTKTGHLKSGNDFLDLINYGISKGISQIFTYIISLDGRFRFCGTGVEFALYVSISIVNSLFFFFNLVSIY